MTCMALLTLQEYYRFVPGAKIEGKVIDEVIAPAVPLTLPAIPVPAMNTVTVKPVKGETVIIADSLKTYDFYVTSDSVEVRNQLVKIGRVKVVTEVMSGELERTTDDFTFFKVVDGPLKGKSGSHTSSNRNTWRK